MISFVSVGVVESLHNLRLSATPPVVVADADKEVWGFIALLLLLLLFCSMGELTVFSVTAAYLTTLAVSCCCTLGDCMDLTLDRTGESNGLLFSPPVRLTGEDDSSSNGLPVNTVTSHRNPSIMH